MCLDVVLNNGKGKDVSTYFMYDTRKVSCTARSRNQVHWCLLKLFVRDKYTMIRIRIHLHAPVPNLTALNGKIKDREGNSIYNRFRSHNTSRLWWAPLLHTTGWFHCFVTVIECQDGSREMFMEMKRQSVSQKLLYFNNLLLWIEELWETKMGIDWSVKVLEGGIVRGTDDSVFWHSDRRHHYDPVHQRHEAGSLGSLFYPESLQVNLWSTLSILSVSVYLRASSPIRDVPSTLSCSLIAVSSCNVFVVACTTKSFAQKKLL